LSSLAQHRTRAENNEFLRDELGNPFWDWAVTATFYAAVHYVEAYLAATRKPAVHSKDHAMRDDEIKRDAVLSTVFDEYMSLKQDSTDARYRPHIEIRQEDVTRVRADLDVVKKAIIPHLPK
jgi:hypothetical protein